MISFSFFFFGKCREDSDFLVSWVNKQKGRWVRERNRKWKKSGMQQKGMRFRVPRGKSCVGWLEEVNYGSSWRLIRHMRRERERERRGKLQNKTRLPTYLPSPIQCNHQAATRTRVKTRCRIASKEKERYKV